MSGRVGTPLTLHTLGGSGTGAVTFAVTNGTAQGCTLSGTALSATRSGTCMVTATKGPDVNYGPVSTLPTVVTMYAKPTSARPAVVSLVFPAAGSTLSAPMLGALASLSHKLRPGAVLTVTGYAKANPGLALRRANAAAKALKSDTQGAVHVTIRTVTATAQSLVTVSTIKN